MMTPGVSILMSPSMKRHQPELILGTCRHLPEYCEQEEERKRDPWVIRLQTYSEPVCRQVPGAAEFRISLRQSLPSRPHWVSAQRIASF